MGLFSGCLLVSDIDGTLLHNGIIPQRNIKEIDRFKNEGGIFAIATGRTVTGAKESYDISHSNAPVIAFHGGCAFDYEKQEFLYHITLDESCKIALKKIIDTFPEIGIEIHSGLKIYEIRSTNGTQWHKNYENLYFEKQPYDAFSFSWTKVLMSLDNFDTLKKLNEYCKQFDCCQFMNTCNNPKAVYYEMVPFGVDKGTALNKMKELTKSKFTFSIGDFYNDTELIKAADFGAATAGAPEDIKSIAKFVTGPCENGAVADLIIKAEQVIKKNRKG